MTVNHKNTTFAQGLAAMLQQFQRRTTLIILASVLSLGALWFIYWTPLGSSMTVHPWKDGFRGSEPAHHERPPHDEFAITTKPEHAVEVEGQPQRKVVGLVLYGRREYVRILDCYLKRNLKSNGGMLDGVIFVPRTSIQEDLDYLEELLPTEPAYSRFEPDDTYGWFPGMWAAVKEPDTIYVKIDDDVVYIADNTLAAMVKRMEENPDYFAVSANVVNNPAISWVHEHLGVYYPYWPVSIPTPQRCLLTRDVS
jgi:hypothetical protein